MKRKILVVEDDATLNILLTDQLQQLGYNATGVRNWAEVIRYQKQHEPHLVLMDVRLPDANGLEKLPELVEETPVIMLTAYGSVKDAVQAMQAGAAEYVVKPINPDELEMVVKRVLETTELRQQHHFCKLRSQKQNRAYMVGESPALDELNDMIDAVAPSDMTVLIQGESGTGKELVANAIHQRSDRHEKNFVAVDCCSLQEKLFESELFGHERGAFTGADRQKKGLIEAAEGGTLFLDEIGEIETTIQAKLLRILETGRFRRVGGIKDLPANVRIVAATNRDLNQMIQEGHFRSDLYYRLSAFILQAPPLRKRRNDIPDLVTHFIRNHGFSRRIDKFANPKALEQLAKYDWPGNIRELKNVVERAIILSRNHAEIGPQHLAFFAAAAPKKDSASLSFDDEPSLEHIEKQYLNVLLEKYHGHRLKVARILGVSERNIYRLLEKYGFK